MTAAATILHLGGQREKAQQDLREMTLLALQTTHRAKQAEWFRDQVLAVMRECKWCRLSDRVVVARIERIIRNEVGA